MHAIRLGIALLVPLSLPARAEWPLGAVGESEIGFAGMVQYDANRFDEDVADLDGAAGDGATRHGVRRVVLLLTGKRAPWDWVFGYDPKREKFLEANVRYRRSAWFAMAGQYNQPNSLEEITHKRQHDFIADAMPTNLFALGLRLGVAAGVEHERWGATLGRFGRELTPHLAGGSGYVARAHGTPFASPRGLLHLGVSFADLDTGGFALRLRTPPDADFARAWLVDTTPLRNVDRQRTLGLETAYLRGPFKVQAEYFASRAERYATDPRSPPVRDFHARGGYVQAIWNVTGESWRYRAGGSTTELPTDRRRTLWQLGARYDFADLDDHGVAGGLERNLTLGINAYRGRHLKLQLNHVFARASGRSAGTEEPRVLELRVQVHW